MPNSAHLWTGDMLKGPNHCPDLQGSSFVIFFDDYEVTSVRKNFS